MRSLAAGWRLVRMLAHLASGLFTIAFTFPRIGQPERNARVQQWAGRMLGVLGIGLELHGTPPAAGPVLLVANHISWLDILVMHAARHCRFVSKSELRHWPVVGTLATAAGTLYIERASRRDAMRVVHSMAQSLREGDVLAIFPEGTTSDGTGLLPFHANLLQAAISADAPVQPVALSFLDAASGAISVAPSYIGDDALVASIWRTLTAPPLTAVVRFGDAQTCAGMDRRAWAVHLQAEVQRLRVAPR